MSDIELLAVDHNNWPNAVISAAIATPPGSPSFGDRYIVASSPTGAWSGHTNAVARWNGSAWLFQVPTAGRFAYNEATTSYLKFDGANWVAFTASGTLQSAYDAGATISLSSTDLVTSDGAVEVLRLGSSTKLAAPTQPTANTTGYALTITGSTGGAAAVSGTPGDGGTVTIVAGTMGSETASPGSAVGGVAGNNLILQGGSGGNVSGAKSGSVLIDGGQLGTGAAGGTPVPGDVKIGTDANKTYAVRVGQSTSGTPLEIKGPAWTPLTTLTDAATVTVTIAKGNSFKVVLGGNRTLDFSFPTSYSNSSIDITGHCGTLVVQQDATGSRTLAFATKVKTAGDTTLNSAANAYTVFEFYVESLTIVHLRKVESAASATTANALASASTTVNVSSATAPTSGQVLTATSGTAATWQTPSSGVSLTSNAPANVTATTAAVGTGTAAARDDHKHNIATAAPSTLVVGGSNTTGTSTSLALADHLHALPAFGTTSGTFMQGNQAAGGDASGTLNALTVTQASGLKSATTTVAVSSATAPSSGQVLTATSSTAATWQAPAGGAPSGTAGGDLGGTYPNPTVTQARGLLSATTTVSVSGATAPSSGQVLTATSSTTATWQAAAGGAPTGTAGGDLGGTYPNPTVTQAAGLKSATTTVAVSSATAPSTGQVLTATSSTAATWQTPTGGAASDLATTGTNVNVSAAAPPTIGKVLMATDATHATWQTVESAFDPTTSINPRNYWRASGTGQTGGFVDSITDIGRVGGKNFTQTGTARCATATDGNGHTYLAPNGTSQYYQAGTNADWKFLHNGSAFTIAIVLQRTAAVTAAEWLLDTCNGTSLSTGISLSLDFTSSTVQGPFARVGRSATSNFSVLTNHYVPDTNIGLLVIRHQGPGQVVTVTASSTPVDMTMRRNGRIVSQCSGQGVYDTGNSAGALTLFAKSNASGFTAARVYEIWVDDSSVSDRLIQSYEGWANTNYASLS